MIVLPDAQDRWRLVRQIDHAQISGQIAAAWKRPAVINPVNWERVILAVIHHDDGWREADADPMLDARGRPYDFLNMPTERHIDIWRLSLERMAERDLLAGLLVTQLAHKLYREHGHGGEAEQTFIRELTGRIEQQTKQLSRGNSDDQAALEPVSLATAVSLLAFFDGLSLQMLKAIPPQTTWKAIPFGDQQATLTLGCAGLAFTLDPWPLAKELTLAVETSRENLSFTLTPSDA